MDWSTATDLSDVVDGLESVTLRRRDGLATTAIQVARRVRTENREAEASAGQALQTDATWYLQLEGAVTPQIGDTLVDQQGSHWTILAAEYSVLLARWKCTARELRLAYGCGERVDIERPVWVNGEGGPEIVRWNYVATAVPVRIQPLEVSRNSTTDEGHARFQIILGESLTLEPQDRFTAGNGAVYRLVSYRQAERIDALPVAVVEREG